MDDDTRNQIAVATGIVDNLVYTMMSDVSSLLLEHGVDRKTITQVMRKLSDSYGAGGVTIRKRPLKATPSARDFTSVIESSKKKTSKFMPSVTWKKISSLRSQPKLLGDCWYADNGFLGMKNGEKLVGESIEGEKVVLCVMDGDCDVRYITKAESERFVDMGMKTNEDSIVDVLGDFLSPDELFNEA